ncbi:uncharacterized protein SPAPADRAFT_133116 [Spathaspora passalidarum NRRL Y-27907]|uniref:Uncharacterized protein n=1 Tax=Spathaspora passalidarum (strain NRRL Y-27907 / 11-Y1) TaxID=619300 RepID=G3AE82_SPAPN|nr:uncharacterized protein SPAPADRAFT_133116 [Spathaspora passalidarum NRRL Y-27907]EGW35616.1 hypothetical protein SPAPADRAFT_133116 [Spathaspora passalidarum NRRL Y-27907]
MIILPNTPPLPSPLPPQSNLNPSLLTSRTALQVANLNSYNDSIRYAVDLQHYLQSLIHWVKETTNSQELNKLVDYASSREICLGIPWTNTLQSDNSKREKLNQLLKSSSKIPWSLLNEIEMVLASISLIYIRIGSDLTSETIEVEADPKSLSEYNEKWKQVVNFYKTSISYTMFANKIKQLEKEGPINGVMFTFIEKISDICIQMSILSKSCWINRCSGNPATSNNGTLSRVAIYVLNELKNAKNIVSSLGTNITLDYRLWNDYLSIIEKYVSAYAGMFLSIENYQQDKLGDAIGLIHFSLLCLQSKKNIDNSDSKKFIAKLKSKVVIKKNEHILNNLNSISTLNINRSAFNDKSGVILNDLSYLFEQLIGLNLKFTKENNNLKFDRIVSWKDISQDSKWPLGTKIPVSNIKPYEPFTVEQEDNNRYIGKGAYY